MDMNNARTAKQFPHPTLSGKTKNLVQLAQPLFALNKFHFVQTRNTSQGTLQFSLVSTRLVTKDRNFMANTRLGRRQA
jgi:hypothetical protein